MQELARKFTRDEIIPRAAEFDNSGEFPWEIVKKAHSVGLMNGHIPAEYGGLGLNSFENCIVTEQLAYGCTGILLAIEGTMLGQTPVLLFGNDAQKKKYLGRLIEEPLLAVSFHLKY